MPTTQHATRGVSQPQPPVVSMSCCCRPRFFSPSRNGLRINLLGQWGVSRALALWPPGRGRVASAGSPQSVLRE